MYKRRLAALAAVPFLLQRIGVERFGLLSLAWVLIGYFSLFDLGLGRALTKMIAERDDGRHADELSSLCSTGAAMVTALGVAGGLLVAIATPLAGPWLDGLSPALRPEVLQRPDVHIEFSDETHRINMSKG